jgi:predicted component of type VI protein secretion system
MGLKLTIENQTSLPDGGPLSVSIEGKRGIDIGRDQYLDWTLPDPQPLHLRQALRSALARRRILAAQCLNQRYVP